MVDAQEVGRHDKQAVVLERDGARCAIGVQVEEGDEDDQQVERLVL